MAKKKAIKLATASAIAASAFVAAAPAQTDAASNVATEVSKAVTQMKKAYHTYSDVTATGDFADINAVYAQYNAAKKAYTNAKAVVTKAGGATKDAYLAQLDSTYAEYIAKRVVTYIDAYNYATTLEEKAADLEAALAAKDWDEVESLYHAISKELKSRTVILDRVYGKSTRELLKTEYKVEAQAARDAIAYEVTVKIALDKAEALVAEGKLVEAKAQLDKAAENVAKIDKDSDFGKALVTAQTEVVAAYEAKLTPAVESVTAINAKELVVKFNKAVDAKTVFVDAAASTTVLKASTFFAGADDLSGEKATLSADGKTLTITAPTNWEGTFLFKVAKETVKATDNKFVSEYNEKYTFEDNAAPTILGTETVNAAQVNVNFSEPIDVKGNVTAKYADGTAVAVGATVNGKSIELDLSSVTAGKSVTVTFVGTSDFAGNIVNPNPATVTVTKGEADGTKPSITSVTPVSPTKFEVKLSEQVQFAGSSANSTTLFHKDDLVVTNNAAGALTVSKVTQDSTDKTKYVVELSAPYSGLATVAVAADSFKDLTGENNQAFSKVVEFKADTVKPTLSSTSVSKDVDGNEVLKLVFSEDVTRIATSGTIELNSKKVKDYVTTENVALTFNATDLVPVSGKTNEFTVKLSAITEKVAATALTQGATYTVDLAADVVEDTAGNNNIASSAAFSITRGADTVSSLQEVVTVTNGSNNSELIVTFKHDVDGATATDKANYVVGGGAVVEKAEVLSTSKKQVRLTLKDASNTVTGDVYVAINGVKTAAGVAMEKEAKVKVGIVENVAPTFTASLIDLSTIKVTFSENVIDGTDGITLADFDVYYNGSQLTETATTGDVLGVSKSATDATAVVASTDEVGTVYIKVKAGVIADISKALEVKTQGTQVEDVNGNVWKSATVSVSK